MGRRLGIGGLERLYTKVTADSHDDAPTLNVKSVLALDNDKPASAVEFIGRAVVISPNDSTYLFQMAKACAAGEWWEDAAMALRRLIYLDPMNGENWFGLGRAFEELRDPEAAYFCFNQCLELEADHQGALEGLNRTGRFDG